MTGQIEHMSFSIVAENAASTGKEDPILPVIPTPLLDLVVWWPPCHGPDLGYDLAHLQPAVGLLDRAAQI